MGGAANHNQLSADDTPSSNTSNKKKQNERSDSLQNIILSGIGHFDDWCGCPPPSLNLKLNMTMVKLFTIENKYQVQPQS